MDVKFNVFWALDPHALLVTTPNAPDTKLPEILSVIEFVPCPDTIVVPEGAVHV
jgi:hypothetical protein